MTEAGAQVPAPAPLPARGRFAPSPTGRLHFGSLIAAVASFADARAQGGEWLLRMEDLDRVREVPGAAQDIMDTLAAFGLDHDGAPVFQSERTDAYAQALDRLAALGLVYGCACSRAQVARRGPEGHIYPGTCRGAKLPDRPGVALRLIADGPPVRFHDLIQGEQEQEVDTWVGDFVVRRADLIHAYQLAVVVDDAWQGIDRVVRGADLLHSTPRQILLQRLLGLPTPVYAHVPLALGPDGRKLSKSLACAPVDPADPLPALLRAWSFLGQPPLPRPGSVAQFWGSAIARWRIGRVPARVSIELKPAESEGRCAPHA